MATTTLSHSGRHPRPSRTCRDLTVLERTILALLAVGVIAAASISTSSAQPAGETIQVKVRRGDTLWSIAATHPVTGLDTGHTADLIDEMNGLDGKLVEGTIIVVPQTSENGAVAMR